MIISTFIHAAMGFLPLFIFLLINQGVISLSALALFPLFLPIFLYSLGLSWGLSALGVFLRDINAIIPAAVTVLMFMSAIFFPITAIPAAWRWVIMLNPAAVLISMARNTVVFSQWPDCGMYGIQLAMSMAVAIVGYAFFMKVKPAFADVL